jgi:hypothetical protein
MRSTPEASVSTAMILLFAVFASEIRKIQICDLINNEREKDFSKLNHQRQ